MPTDVDIVANAGTALGIQKSAAARWAKFIRIAYPDEYANVLKNPVYAASSDIKYWAAKFRQGNEYVASAYDLRMMAALFMADGINPAKGYLRKQFRARGYKKETIDYQIEQVIDLLQHQQSEEIEQFKASPPIEGGERMEEIMWTIADTPFVYAAFKGDGSQRKNNWGIYESTEAGLNVLQFGVTRESAENAAKNMAEEQALRLNKQIKQLKSVVVRGFYPLYPGQLKTDKKEYIMLSMVPSQNKEGKYVVHLISLGRYTKKTRDISKLEAENLVFKTRNITDINAQIRQLS